MAKLGSRVQKLESMHQTSEFAHLGDEELEQMMLELGQKLGLLDKAGRYIPGPTTPGDELEKEVRMALESLPRSGTDPKGD
jgi:hypothetical protein